MIQSGRKAFGLMQKAFHKFPKCATDASYKQIKRDYGELCNDVMFRVSNRSTETF